MHLEPHTQLALHRSRTDRASRDPRWQLPPRARPPGRWRTALARLLRGAADRLADERATEPAQLALPARHR